MKITSLVGLKGSNVSATKLSCVDDRLIGTGKILSMESNICIKISHGKYGAQIAYNKFIIMNSTSIDKQNH